jgi:hypothetical protein
VNEETLAQRRAAAPNKKTIHVYLVLMSYNRENIFAYESHITLKISSRD